MTEPDLDSPSRPISRQEHEQAARRVLGEDARWCPTRSVWHHSGAGCPDGNHEPLPPLLQETRTDA